jgi:transposase-like protein
MKAKRKRYDAQFKAKIGFEAIRGIKTVQQIAKENQIHPTQVNQWKQILIEDASSLFEGKRPSQDQDDWENERDRLHAKIGQQSVEIDWLAKSASNCISNRASGDGRKRPSPDQFEKAV